MTSKEIRQQYLDFFVQRHGHTLVPSSPVVPVDDPTLLFTNAGMNQFKPYFLGTQKAPWSRVADTQKCIRAGGKHNDLDDVGRSRRHHTFFEMLGNWSFGDYFKRGAIEMAWELLTKVWKLDPTRLHVTCFEGDEANGVPRDTEAAQLWKEIARLPENHIHYFGADNFWEMGETGPCGPCSEIYIDRTPDKTGGKLVNGEDPRVMEIWNLVFIQYNRNPDRTLTALPQQHVDTGMGFERMTHVIQNVQDNYAIDLFFPFWQVLSDLSGRKYTGKYPPTNKPDPVAEAADEQLRSDIAFRVIADHIRSLTFAMTDGAVPSNEGRGYVLRRILRRAVRFGRQQLELREPFMHKLVPVVVDAMGEAFPELKKHSNRIADTIKDEELSFGKTLDRGIELFEEAAMRSVESALPNVVSSIGPTRSGFAGQEMLPAGELWRIKVTLLEKDGAHKQVEIPSDAAGQRSVIDQFALGRITLPAGAAFKLHDTYGFPIDLTRIMAEERGMSVDIVGYEKLMEEAKERARAGGKEGASRLFEMPPDVLAKLSERGAKPTDDSAKFNAAPIGASVRAIWDGSKLIETTHGSEAAGQGVAVILDQTNFYAEMGGQVGDTGELRSHGGAVMAVETTRAAGGYVLHVGNMVESHLSVGDHVTATLAGVRPRTEKNHTATHLANWALREVLGEGVQQKGSLVDPEKLRFDFSHSKSLADDEVERIETLVAERIDNKLTVYAENAPQEHALKINGLRAVFGEKYPPMVRVVSIGAPMADLLKDPGNAKWREYSIEFCGGTHLRSTDEAGAFVITSEESVSKGIRRIFALTGESAREAQRVARQVEQLVERARAVADGEAGQAIGEMNKLLATPNVPLRAKRRGQAMLGELQAKQKAWEKSQRSSATGVDAVTIAGELLSVAPALAGGKLVVGEISEASDEQLRSAMDSLKKKSASYAIMLAAAADGKVSFVAAVSDDLIARGLKAGDWIRETAKVAGGGGGGRPQMAQAGGKDPAKIGEALEVARRFAVTKVG